MYSAGYPATTLFCPVILSQLPALFILCIPLAVRVQLVLASACLQLPRVWFSFLAFLWFSLVFFSLVGLLPFHHVEVLVPTGAFESSCRKAPTKTVSRILPASDKPAPSFSSRCSNVLLLLLLYSTSYCCCASFSWRSLLESWRISTTSR